MRHSFAALLFLTASLYGQSVRVSVRSSVEAALLNHASVRIAGERVNAASARYDEAGASLLPKLQVTGRAIQLSDVEQGTITVPFLPGSPSIPLFPVITHSYAARVQLTQPVFSGFRLSENKEAARHGLASAEADQARDRADLVLEVQTAYWTWVQVREAQNVLEETAGQMREHEARVKHLADQGLTTHSDVLAVRVRRSDVEIRAIEMRTKASLAMMRLNFLMGVPLETELEPADLPDSIGVSDSPVNADALVTNAIQDRPDLVSARLRTEMAKSNVAMASAGWYPTVGLAAAYEYSSPNQRIIPPKDRFDGTWEVGLTFQWNVWDWMTTSRQTAQAEAFQRQSEAGYELMLGGVRLEIAQLTRQWKDGVEKVSSARLAVEAAQESYRIIEQRFGNGLATSVDVTDARVEVLRSRLSFTQAAAEVALTRARLQRAVGDAS